MTPSPGNTIISGASLHSGRIAGGRSIGRGVRRELGVMNGTERAYAVSLRLRCDAGEISWFAFDAIKLRLAEKTFYTPDFLVMRKDGDMEVHEVKGFWEQDARVKIKVAAAMFPFRFIAVTKSKSGWEVEEF